MKQKSMFVCRERNEFVDNPEDNPDETKIEKVSQKTGNRFLQYFTVISGNFSNFKYIN